MKTVRTLVHAWLVLDFFGDARRSGGASSTLTTTIFTQSFLALVFAALLYPETPPVPFAAANLCLSTLLVATGALGDHDQLNRRRADQTLLGTAPIARRTVVFARSGHAAFYVCLVTIGMALPPAILLACLRSSPLQAVLYVVAACACSGLATGALATAIRGLARCFGQARAALLAGTGTIDVHHVLLENARPVAMPSAAPISTASGDTREGFLAVAREHQGNASAIARVLSTSRSHVRRLATRYGVDLEALRR